MHFSRIRIQIAVSIVSIGAIAGVAVAPAAAITDETSNIPFPMLMQAQQPVSGGGMLTPDAAALSPDPSRALELYWTPARRAAAKPADRGLRTSLADKAGAQTSMRGRLDVGATTPQADTDAVREEAGVNVGVASGSSGTSWPYRHDWVALTNGKVFFTMGGVSGWQCSAVVVTTEAANTVFTAGHCVHSGPDGPGWHTNWVFIPDYYNGDRPLGTWLARPDGLWSLNGWVDDGDWDYDIGAVVMQSNSAGQRLAHVTGSQGIRINGLTSVDVWSFGFAAGPNPPYNGEDLITCDGHASRGVFSNEMEMLCNVRRGASGGAWLAEFNGDWGYTVSVFSNFIERDPLTYYGPYFGDGAYNLYQAVRSLA